MDPQWTQAAAEEGVVAYKNLLGPGQNMSHVPGADVEAQVKGCVCVFVCGEEACAVSVCACVAVHDGSYISKGR